MFCLDISGSMCVSQPIVGKHKIKGDKTGQQKNQFAEFMDGSDQFLQNEKNVTYVSRIQCVQAAVENQLMQVAEGAPQRKVGIVTFNHEVQVIGDATKDPQTIAGDKLQNYDWLAENGTKEGEARLQNPIEQTRKVLLDKLLGLEETGPTALGPAALTAIAMAA